MCDALNIMARVDGKPDMMCSSEEFHGRRYRGPVLLYMMPEHCSVKRAVKLDPKGKVCFDLNPGTYHTMDCKKIMLSL